MGETTHSEVGRFEFGKNGKVILSKLDAPVTYYKVNWLLWTWVACAAKDRKGCAALEKASLSLDRAPPPMRGQPMPASASPEDPGAVAGRARPEVLGERAQGRRCNA